MNKEKISAFDRRVSNVDRSIQGGLKERLFYMDAMRGVLMALGVVLHSSQVFNQEKSWLIYSSLSVPLAGPTIDIIHTFRMPAFFIVSGFFCLDSLRRYGQKKFLKLRCERIIIPLVTTALTLNSIQALLLDLSGWQPFSLNAYVWKGVWDSHLWFLNYLVLYILVAYVVANLVSYMKESLRSAIGDWLDRIPRRAIFLLPMITILISVVCKIAPSVQEPVAGIFLFYKLIYYGQFFLFGVLLYWRKDLLEEFTHLSALKTLTTIIVLVWFNTLLEDGYSLLFRITHYYIDVLIVWFSCALCFYFFKTYANRPSKISLFLSDSSYTVYLFHHILVIAFGLIFIYFGIGGYWGLASLIMVTFSASLFIHVGLVNRLNWMSYLFNGKRLSARPRVSAPILKKPVTKVHRQKRQGDLRV